MFNAISFLYDIDSKFGRNPWYVGQIWQNKKQVEIILKKVSIDH